MGLAFRGSALAALMLLGSFAARAEDYPVGTRDSIWSDPGTYMIGSFRHMGELYPSRIVHRAGPVSELPQDPALALSSYVFTDDAPLQLEDYFERARTTGFIVLKRGQIVYER